MQSALERSIVQAVDELQSATVDLLRDLVRIPTITGDEAEGQRFIAQHLAEMGLEMDVWSPTRNDVVNHPAFSDDGLPLGDRPVVVGRWRGTDPNARSLIVNGHMDVVPVGNETAWTGGPWSGAVRDGNLWGRGSCDMKGGLVAGLAAIAALQQVGIRPRGDVLIQSVIGEETGGVGTLAALIRGYRADAAIILEPTRLHLCPIGAGAASFRLHVRGRAAHAATRLEGVSAIEKFLELHTALQQLENMRHSRFHHRLFKSGQLVAPLSIGKVQSGDWPSTVPEYLLAEGRYGVLPGEGIASARKEFEAVIGAAADGDPWLRENRPIVEWFEGQFEPGETPSNAPILQTIDEAHKTICGNSAEIHGVPYGSDLRLFTNKANMHAVLYGPGDVAVAHSVNEHISLDEISRATKVVALTIVKWCGV